MNKLSLISKAYVTYKKGDKEIWILNTDLLDAGTQGAILNIQYSLDVDFELSYEIMADACQIISEKTLDELISDDCDFFADADSRANVYTAVQLSYLNIKNEAEISDLMKDEAITSIAQACSIWYSQKVVEACEALRDYINQ